MSKISLLTGFCILSMAFCYISAESIAQVKYPEEDTITIYHKYYSTTFSKSKHFPVVVKYWLTWTMLDCDKRFKRKNKFKPDPLIPKYTNLEKDYKKSGYDRGHQMDAFDCGCDSIAMAESFYYSNVTPQRPSLNRGICKRLEDYTRKLVKDYDSIVVWCGSVTLGNRYIGEVAVPDFCWKIFYVKRSDVIKAYSFKNDVILNRELQFFEVSIDFIRSLSGFAFVKHKG